MVINKESIPPPLIGKAGRYTVFITPPVTPKPSSESKSPLTPKSFNLETKSPKSTASKLSIEDYPKISSTTKIVPPVQPPPHQFEKLGNARPSSDSSVIGFFRNAVTKVQNAHSSLDEYIANWFGLDHSKYQWALDDYYENQGMGKGDKKPKEITSKEQNV